MVILCSPVNLAKISEIKTLDNKESLGYFGMIRSLEEIGHSSKKQFHQHFEVDCIRLKGLMTEVTLVPLLQLDHGNLSYHVLSLS